MPADVLKLLAAVHHPAPDADLLARFVTSRDEAAFAELVRRHGPAVYRTCKHLLGSSSADDAFQATFLVLACRAKSVRKVASVGSWLIGVAGRVSRQMRRSSRRAAGVSRLMDENAGGDGQEQRIHSARSPELGELAAILNEELARLPDSLRAPVVLCLVEGQTQEQAAAALGGSVRTLRRRLDRAKALLRLRLERRGVVPTVAAGLVASLGSGTAALPPGLAGRTVNGVFAFLTGGRADTPAAFVAKGVVGSMARIKASVLVAATAAVMIGLGVGWADDGPPPAAPPASPPSIPPAKALSEPAKAEPRTAIKFTGPDGMKITWEQPDKPNQTVKLVTPGEYAFLQGQTYRLALSQVPDLAGKRFYPTLEVAPAAEKTRAFLAHASVPVRFTDEDFSQAEAGNLVVKVLYLPDPALQDPAAVAGAEEIISPRLEPGADPIAEARKRGTILAVVRLGNIDLNVPNALPGQEPGTQPPAVNGQSANFAVSAPTAVMARAIANEAEYQRKRIAERWLGKKLPDWPRCPIRVTVENRKGGATAIQFHRAVKLGHPAYVSAEMELHGPFEYVLTTGLPHEVAHTVLAAYFGKPVPRWADEGIAQMAEPPEEQARFDARCRELLQDGNALRLRAMFPAKEYPRDMMALYAQGHSVTRFLVGRSVMVGMPELFRLRPARWGFRTVETGHQQFVVFLHRGLDGKTDDSWDNAAKEVYGFASVDDLEAAWLDWLKKPESKLGGSPAPKPADPNLIPPTPLPGGVPRPFLPAPAIPDRIPPTKLPGGAPRP